MSGSLHQAGRSLARSPGYALAVILTLALGIGGAAAVASVLRSVLLRPLPSAPADRVMSLFESDSLGNIRPISYPTFQDLRTAAPRRHYDRRAVRPQRSLPQAAGLPDGPAGSRRQPVPGWRSPADPTGSSSDWNRRSGGRPGKRRPIRGESPHSGRARPGGRGSPGPGAERREVRRGGFQRTGGRRAGDAPEGR